LRQPPRSTGGPAMTQNDNNVRAHYMWTIEQITNSVPLADLTTAELISLTNLRIPAHSRFLTNTERQTSKPGPRGLQAVRNKTPNRGA
jgi:hypothetical protein